MLLDRAEIRIQGSESVLSFETEGGGSREAWDRYLAVAGKKAVHIGNVCGTCAFFFERMEGANRSVDVKGLVAELNAGLTQLDSGFVRQLGSIVPDGDYVVVLSEIQPRLVAPGDEDDYFSHEQIDLWGVDSFWGMPHFPRTEYYRLATGRMSGQRGYYEFLVPMFPHTWLNEERLSEYRALLPTGKRPSAVAIGVLDVKQPSDWEDDQPVTSHWCLAHYLIDGHHKVYAAATANRPITQISFLAVDRGVCSREDVEEAVAFLGEV